MHRTEAQFSLHPDATIIITARTSQPLTVNATFVRLSLFLSLPLFISVSLHLREQGQCQSGHQRELCSLGKYSTDSKRTQIFFKPRSLLESELYHKVSEDVRFQVRYLCVRLVCKTCLITTYVDFHFSPGHGGTGKKAQFTLIPTITIWQKQYMVYSMPLSREVFKCNLAKHSGMYIT